VKQESSTNVFVYYCVLMMIMEARGMPLIKGSSRQVRENPNRHCATTTTDRGHRHGLFVTESRSSTAFLS